MIISKEQAIPEGLRLTDARHRVLETLAAKPVAGVATLARRAGVSSSVVNGLIDAGAIKKTFEAPAPLFAKPDPDQHGVNLEADQKTAAACAHGLSRPRLFSSFARRRHWVR